MIFSKHTTIIIKDYLTQVANCKFFTAEAQSFSQSAAEKMKSSANLSANSLRLCGKIVIYSEFKDADIRFSH